MMIPFRAASLYVVVSMTRSRRLAEGVNMRVQVTEMNKETKQAMRTLVVQKRLQKLPVPFKFRLNAIVLAGQREGKVWSC